MTSIAVMARALYCNEKVQVRAMNTISCLWLEGALPYESPTFGVSHAYGKSIGARLGKNENEVVLSFELGSVQIYDVS